MTKFICIKSESPSVPVGTVLYGTKLNPGRFVLVRDSDLTNTFDKEPRWKRGEDLPTFGNLWVWEEQPS